MMCSTTYLIEKSIYAFFTMESIQNKINIYVKLQNINNGLLLDVGGSIIKAVLFFYIVVKCSV